MNSLQKGQRFFKIRRTYKKVYSLLTFWQYSNR